MLGFGINRIRPARTHLLCRSAGIRIFVRHPSKILVPWHRFTPLLVDKRTRLEWSVTAKEDPTAALSITGTVEARAGEALREALRPGFDHLELWLPGKRRPHCIVRVRSVSYAPASRQVGITADDRKDRP